MRIVTLDIETITPRWKEGVHGYDPDIFPPLPYHEPCAICWLIARIPKIIGGELPTINQTFRFRSCMIIDPNIVDNEALKKIGITAYPEYDALKTFRNDLIGTKEEVKLVTFNGRGFDMPLMTLRAARYKMDWSFWVNWRQRFPNYKSPLKHIDLLEQFGDYGAARNIGLGSMSELFGQGGKTDIDGSQVNEVWNSGEKVRVVNYCNYDVIDTWWGFIRYFRTLEGMPVEELEELTRQLQEAHPSLVNRYR